MKKFLLAMLLLLFSVPAFAAWTIQAEIDDQSDWENGQRVYRVRVYMISDGTDLAEFNLSTYLKPPQLDTQGKVHPDDRWSEYLQGGILYMVETDPVVAPDSTWSLALDSDKGADLVTLSALSATATEINSLSGSLGFNPIVWDVQVDIGDIGSNLDSVDVYLYIIR